MEFRKGVICALLNLSKVFFTYFFYFFIRSGRIYDDGLKTVEMYDGRRKDETVGYTYYAPVSTHALSQT